MLQFPRVYIHRLLPSTCNCTTLLFKLQNIQPKSPKPFKFFSMLLTNDSIKEVVHDTWPSSIFGNFWFILFKKLWAVNSALKEWNIEVYHHVQDRDGAAWSNLSNIEGLLSIDLTNVYYLKQERDEEGRTKWLQEGDKNLRFFHSVFASHSMRKQIHCIKDQNGNLLSDPIAIGLEAEQFFKILFSPSTNALLDSFFFSKANSRASIFINRWCYRGNKSCCFQLPKQQGT